MRTLNISITDEQYGLIERLIHELGFANRSEFFRAILRTLIGARQIKFQSPPTKDIKTIMSALDNAKNFF